MELQSLSVCGESVQEYQPPSQYSFELVVSLLNEDKLSASGSAYLTLESWGLHLLGKVFHQRHHASSR